MQQPNFAFDDELSEHAIRIQSSILGLRLRPLAAAVVPEDAFFAAHDGAAGGPDGFPEEAQVGAVAVEVDLARGGDEAFFSDDGEAKAARFGELFEAVAQLDLLAGEKFVAEAAEFAE